MTPIEPETVEAARQRVIDAFPLWEHVDEALDDLVAAVRAEAYRSGWNEALRASGGSVLLELAEPAEGEVTE